MASTSSATSSRKSSGREAARRLPARHSRGRVRFATVGSAGDLLPLLAVASRLESQGVETLFALPPNLAAILRGSGFRCVAMPPYSPAGGRGWGFEGLRQVIREHLAKQIAPGVHGLAAHCREGDVVVSAPLQLAGPLAAELTGAQWITASVFPSNISSAFVPPPMAWLPALPGVAGRALNRLGWEAHRRVVARAWEGPVNGLRRYLGLPAREHAFDIAGVTADRCLLLCSEVYLPRAPDWPRSLVMTGFAMDARNAPIPTAVERFLDARDPIVVCVQSTASGYKPRDFFESAASCSISAHWKTVLLVGQHAKESWAQQLATLAPERVLVAGPVPFRPLVNRAALVVHHAGLGTLAHVLEAGRPHLTIPRAFDHPFHARRLRQLGVSHNLPYRKVNPARLRRAIENALADLSLEEHARPLAQRLASEDGAGRAAAEILALLAD